MRYKLRSCLWIPERLIKREGPFYLLSLLLPVVWNEVMVAELQQPFWTQRLHEDEKLAGWAGTEEGRGPWVPFLAWTIHLQTERREHLSSLSHSLRVFVIVSKCNF